MGRNHGLMAVAATAVAFALLAGAAAPDGGVVGASHDPADANYTVVPLGDRSPGATEVEYGQRVVSTAGVDLATLERTTAVYEAGSWENCGPQDGETFGVDRGATRDGYEVDESLEDNVKTFSAGEDVFEVEFNDEDDIGASTYLDDGDEVISVAGCIDNPDEPGWYRISGTTTGVTENGERVTFGGDSHYFYICDCEDETAARQQLGPPPSEPQPTATATPTPGPESESAADEGDAGDGGASSDDGTTPTATESAVEESGGAAAATPTATPTGPAADEGDAGDANANEDAATATPTPARTEGWDDRVVRTPTAADGPGFGAGAAVVALAAAALLVGRR
ncbi:hypothetical protein BRC88_10415 [Halobacteriales archaeon QS_4_69_225]|nr:MAG: hypothetical protein BRC88_10415 [Halobacteriales archaeon QS_4_69_225]